ncbi:MAG: hypothetical protein VYE15_07870, partial [Myxococcota bacterium]|nr:hypothetical protein [Myxococcota bacterium]
HSVGIMLLGLSLIAGALSCAPTYDAAKLEGDWTCETHWTWDNDGEPVPCSVRVDATCKDTKLSSTGVLSLGDAQWDETIEGVCLASGDELHGTRTSVQTVAKNDAARQFETERLGGKTLSSTSGDLPQEFRTRITSFTGTELVTVNQEGRTTTCTRR